MGLAQYAWRFERGHTMISRLFFLFLMAGFCLAQSPVTLTFSTGSSVRVGFSGSRDVLVSSTTGNAPADVQFTLNWQPMFTGVSLVAGQQAIAAGKSVTCGNVTLNADLSFSLPCVLSGLNVTTIANGSLVTVNFTVAKSTTARSGALSVALAAPIPPLSASPAADPLATTGGVAVVPFVQAADLNGDGVVDETDRILAAQQVVGLAPCGLADLNGDGKCDVIDLALLARAALGL
jgi:hypothetical protein